MAFALLDDCDAGAASRSSRLYTRFVRERVCTDGTQLDAVCEAAAADVAAGLKAVVLGDYEFGRHLSLKNVREQYPTQRGTASLALSTGVLGVHSP